MALADAAVVMGARVLPHRPSLELQARLDHALALWQHGDVPVVMVTGGGVGQRDEIRVMTRYLLAQGMHPRNILPCAPGYNTWQSLCSLKRLQKRYGMEKFMIVSSAYHKPRVIWMASYLQLDVSFSSPTTSPEMQHPGTRRTQQLREWLALLSIRIRCAIQKESVGAGALPHRVTGVAEIPASAQESNQPRKD